MTHNFPLPGNFIESLLELTYLVMLKKPKNYLQFAAKYFSRISKTESVDGMLISTGYSLNSEDSSVISTDNTDLVVFRQTVLGEKFSPHELNDVKTEFYSKSVAQKTKLKNVCREIPILNSLSNNEINDMVDAMFEYKIEAGQEILKEGEEGDNFYVIESGIYEASTKKLGKIKNYDNEGSFGELALLYNAPRAATIKAKTNGTLWGIKRNVFRSLVSSKAAKKREVYMEIISNVPMLKTLSEYERSNLTDALVHTECVANEVILQEGEPGSKMYFIISGEVNIYKEILGKKKTITTLGSGKYFGELALLSHQPRAASAVTTKDTQLAILDVKGFERLMGPCIEIMKRDTEKYKKEIAALLQSEK